MVKTKPTGASVGAYLASKASPEQLKDCRAIMAICKRVTKQQPKMWGPGMVGYGSYTYTYESGHSGESCLGRRSQTSLSSRREHLMARALGVAALSERVVRRSAVVGLVMLSACAQRQLSHEFDVPVCADPPASDRSALAAAPAVVARAVAGVRVRGEQDEMLKLEAKLPGFGGWYIDSLSRVVVYMKAGSPASPELARETIYQAYATRPEAIVREIMAAARQARIVRGDYTLSELVAIENRIMSGEVLVPGWTGHGTSLVLNRVTVGFRDAGSVCPGVRAITSMGIPTDALIPEIWGEVRSLELMVPSPPR